MYWKKPLLNHVNILKHSTDGVTAVVGVGQGPGVENVDGEQE